MRGKYRLFFMKHKDRKCSEYSDISKQPRHQTHMQRAHGRLRVLQHELTVPPSLRTFWIMALVFLSLEHTVHNGSSLISKWLHKRSPQDEQIVVMDFVMSLLKFHRHWYVSAELNRKEWSEKAAYVILVVSCAPTRSERQQRYSLIVQQIMLVSDVTCVSRDQPHLLLVESGLWGRTCTSVC